ncbi:MAG: metal-dependent transcriptional regulator [Eubacteriales bacterium]
MDKSEFYTMKGYELTDKRDITTAMEDYLEMILRLNRKDEGVRINDVAHMLHVRPSSASKMTANLREHGFVEFERYGKIKITEQGRVYGLYLIMRHETLNELLCTINMSKDETEQVEKIEHFIDFETIKNLRVFLDKYKEGRH